MYCELGFHQCKSDWRVHICQIADPPPTNQTLTTVESILPITQDPCTITATSVDDILLATFTMHTSNEVTENIKSRFEITDSGDVKK